MSKIFIGAGLLKAQCLRLLLIELPYEIVRGRKKYRIYLRVEDFAVLILSLS